MRKFAFLFVSLLFIVTAALAQQTVTGKITDANGIPLTDYRGKLVTDLYFSYPLNKNFTVYAGADNLLNTHPDFGVVKGAKDWAYNTETGGAWDAVQMGSNGRKLFLRIGFNF